MKSHKKSAGVSEPQWTEVERRAAEETFAMELGELTKHIALGRHKGRKHIASALAGINRKVVAARSLGITSAKLIPNEILHEVGDLVSTLNPLVEFCSSPTMRDSIYTRLRKVLADIGVEEKFLVKIASPSQRNAAGRTTPTA